MKRLAVLLGIMGVAVWLLLSEDDKKPIRNEGEKIKKKFKKSHFPGKESIHVD